MAVTEGGDRHEVVFVGGTGVLPGVRLVDNPKYPGIAADFARTFHRLKSLPCDVFLAPHGFHFDLEEKARRRAAGEEPNPFLDPEGYKSFIDRSERVYLDQLRRERRNSTPPGDARSPRRRTLNGDLTHREYVPISRPSASTCPRIAPISRSFVAPAPNSGRSSRA